VAEQLIEEHGFTTSKEVTEALRKMDFYAAAGLVSRYLKLIADKEGWDVEFNGQYHIYGYPELVEKEEDLDDEMDWDDVDPAQFAEDFYDLCVDEFGDFDYEESKDAIEQYAIDELGNEDPDVSINWIKEVYERIKRYQPKLKFTLNDFALLFDVKWTDVVHDNYRMGINGYEKVESNEKVYNQIKNQVIENETECPDFNDTDDCIECQYPTVNQEIEDEDYFHVEDRDIAEGTLKYAACELKKACYLSGENDFMEVVEWVSGDGYDIKVYQEHEEEPVVIEMTKGEIQLMNLLIAKIEG